MPGHAAPPAWPRAGICWTLPPEREVSHSRSDPYFSVPTGHGDEHRCNSGGGTMRLKLILATIALVLAAAAAAQNITFWHTYSTGSGEEQTMLEQVIPQFEAENPGITVEAVGFPYDEFRQKLLTAFAGGVVPDLVRMDIIWVPEFAEMGALERLDDYAGFAALRDGVFPGPLATNFWDGGYFGLPLDTNTQVMLYNADVISSPPTSFDELEALASDMSDPAAEVWAFAVP